MLEYLEKNRFKVVRCISEVFEVLALVLFWYAYFNDNVRMMLLGVLVFIDAIYLELRSIIAKFIESYS